MCHGTGAVLAQTDQDRRVVSASVCFPRESRGWPSPETQTAKDMSFPGTQKRRGRVKEKLDLTAELLKGCQENTGRAGVGTC